jgi:DNA segregation ATPase FtsK/SpoIIIE, S-DNA-T family
LVALGLALGLVLWPGFRSGEVGVWARGYLADPVGWGSWLWPWPFVVLGGLFLLRRTPPRWPWVLLGYLVAGVGAWGLLMLIAPDRAGTLGVQLRTTLTGAAGVLAFLPAVALLGLGIELMWAWRPGSMARSGILGTFAALRATGRALWRARNRAQARAGFRADVARVRRELRELDLDLAALAGLYPGSGELERWRGSVQQTVVSLRAAEPASLDAARADVAAWRSAVGDFARDRAREIAHQLRAEVAQPPSEGGDGAQRGYTFDDWARHTRALVDEPLAGPARGRLRVVAAAEGVRRALALDLTGLVDRHRRLLRERDLAEAALESARPRDLAPIVEAHAERLVQLQGVEGDARTLAHDTGHLDAWRALLEASLRTAERYPEDEDIASWDADLTAALRRAGRAALADQPAWSEALQAAEIGAREREAQELAALEAASAAAAEALGVSDEDLLQPSEFEPLGALAAPTPLDALHPLEGSEVEAAVDAPPWLPPSPRPLAREREPQPLAGDLAQVGGLPLTLPPAELLDPPDPPEVAPATLMREQRERVARIDATLSSFKLQGRVVASVRGPTVTRFEVEPAQGEKISRFANLADDLALAMAVASVRIEAPIPGKSVIGLEVPNTNKDLIRFREGVEAPAFLRSKARLPIILGKSIDGEMMVGDLARMPHLLIAGSTGSGKSIAVNTLVASLLYRFLPTELRFLMIDPKMVELTPYDGVPHLIRPVVTNPGEAAGVLLGAVSHMERRYKMMSRIGVKNLDQYNAKAKNLDLPELPFIVIVIDELADLMITSPKEVESAIMRLAQMARATGMHLILATQRPSVDILTSLIKVNVPARMAFAVSSGFDSRTILDTMGAERLLGRGDMLYHQPGLPKPLRLQGPFMSEIEIANVGDFLRRQFFDDDFVDAYAADFEPALPDDSSANGFIDWNDDKLRAAAELVITEGEASVSRLQRRLQVGHARAGKLMDSLENLGVVGPHNKSKARDVLVTLGDLPNIFGR